MANSATEILNEQSKQRNKFSIGEVFSTSFSMLSYEFPIFFLMIMAAGLPILVASIVFTFMMVSMSTSGYDNTSFSYIQIFVSSLVFVAYAVLYPIAALFISRRILVTLRTVQTPTKFEIQLRHYFLAIGIGILLAVVNFLIHSSFSRVALSFQGDFQSNSYFILGVLSVLASGFASLIVLSIFSLLFILFIPASIAEDIEFSSIFQRVNMLVQGKRLQIFTIMLISSAIIWGVLNLVLNIWQIALMPEFMLSYGIIGIIRFPIQGFLYAYLFMLPAVIYHHLRLEELSRESA